MESDQHGYESDTPVGDDHLSIKDDALLLANFLLSEKMDPPLSIGVFGQHGQGRSFFLHMIEHSLNEIENYNEVGIVHVHFSAQLNAETNAWIALIDTIYRALEHKMEKRFPTMVDRTKFFENLKGTAKRLHAQARAKLDSAKSAVTKAEATLKLAIDQHRKNLTELAKVKSWQRWQDIEKKYWSDQNGSINKDGKKLGIENLNQRPEDLHNLLEQTKSIDGLASVISSSVSSTPWFGTAMAVIVGIIGAAVLFGVTYYLLGSTDKLKDSIDLLGKSLGIAGTVLGATGALSLVALRNRARGAIRRLWHHRDRIRNAERNADRDHLLKWAEVEEDVTVSREALSRIRERAQQAQHSMALAEKEYEEFIKPGILRRVIEYYRDTLVSDVALGASIVPIIQEDIDALSNWLVQNVPETNSVGADVIEHSSNTRIVVYIDDLDRCPPEHLFSLLQASNLFLSMPHFIVIMVMNPFSAMHALKSRYTQLLEPTEDVSIDYMGNLLQIPFWLSQPTKESVQMFVRQIAEPEKKFPAENEYPPEPFSIDLDPIAPKTDTPDFLEPDKVSVEFEFDQQQFDFIIQIASVSAITPRDVKRLVGLCRLATAKIKRDNHESHQEFMAVTTLLAIIVGVPEIAPVIFNLIDEGRIRYFSDIETFPLRNKVAIHLMQLAMRIFEIFFHYVEPDKAQTLLQDARNVAARHSFNVPPLSKDEFVDVMGTGR